MTELKPCPFCGGEAIAVQTQTKSGKVHGVHVQCQRCRVRNATWECISYAVDDWNTRIATGLECCANCAERDYHDGVDICPHIPMEQEHEIPTLAGHCKHWIPCPMDGAKSWR